jgi:hypothetical protein
VLSGPDSMIRGRVDRSSSALEKEVPEGGAGMSQHCHDTKLNVHTSL